MRLACSVVVSLGLCAEAVAGHYDLDDLAFMQGEWVGESGERRFAEYWTDGGAGAMAGVFKLTSGDKLIVVELMLISQEEERPVLRFKHYRADYSTWEGTAGAPVELALSEAGAGRATFTPSDPGSAVRSLDYVLAGGVLTATVTVRADDDPDAVEAFSFAYRRPADGGPP